MSRYDNDPRVSGHGRDRFTVTRDDGTEYRVLPTGVLGWVVCAGPNLDFAPSTDGGFAIGFASADDAISAVLDTGTHTDGDTDTDGM